MTKPIVFMQMPNSVKYATYNKYSYFFFFAQLLLSISLPMMFHLFCLLKKVYRFHSIPKRRVLIIRSFLSLNKDLTAV